MTHQVRSLWTGVLVSTLGGAAMAQGQGPEMAKMGAEISGYNYQNAVICNAPASFLAAYKTKKQRDFAAAGADFDTQFTAGKAEATTKWQSFVTEVGEAKARSSVCIEGHYVADMQAKLAKEK